ncbi:U32 family peptidase [Candidatus Woesearchaeota archaeon]|nr:U32 family peptidase [Candidatus Woesearchaeota archaeon]
MNKKPELMAPAGDWIMLKVAINAGANAIYFGLKELNMRAEAENFKISELDQIVGECHKNKVKAYLTLNTIIYETEIVKVKEILIKAKKAKIDAIIAWDFAIIKEAKKLKLNVFLSTQASVANSEAVEEYKKLGIKRIVLARECSLDQIKKIKSKTKLQVEVFIHGAMCVSLSGRCFMSHHLFGKSANRGECLQPCRRQYLIKDAEEPNELILGKDYVMSPKDLCTINFIDKIIETKADAFKIEGRKRSAEYVYTVVSAYRKAIDLYFKKKLNLKIKDDLSSELEKVYNRGFSSGFYFRKPSGNDFIDVHGSKATERKVYVGKVLNFYNKIKVAAIKIYAAELKLGDEILVQGKTTGVIKQELKSMEVENKKIKSAKKGKIVAIKLDKIARINDSVYKIKKVK